MVKLDQICLSPYFQTKHETFLWKLWTNVEYIFTRFRAWNIEIVRPAPRLSIICSCHFAINKYYKYTNLVPESFANQPKMKLYLWLVNKLERATKQTNKVIVNNWRKIALDSWPIRDPFVTHLSLICLSANRWKFHYFAYYFCCTLYFYDIFNISFFHAAIFQ